MSTDQTHELRNILFCALSALDRAADGEPVDKAELARLWERVRALVPRKQARSDRPIPYRLAAVDSQP